MSVQEKLFDGLGKDSLTDSNIFIQYLTTKRTLHRNSLYYLLWDFGYQLSEVVHFTNFQIMKEIPGERIIILADGNYSKFTSKKYGMTAFTVHIDGKIDTKLSKIWRYYLREYIGKPYAEAFARYVQEHNEDHKEEINFLLNQFDSYDQRKNYINNINA